uniref:Uncharacterized protein n=1 Tax=Nelumbo nucifera TaxID=4432 RepID=A0A822XYI8_NELNU|nr:TPA_asm: hypothetical protein HUJ06_026831 [Nelumbo nucifera]
MVHQIMMYFTSSSTLMYFTSFKHMDGLRQGKPCGKRGKKPCGCDKASPAFGWLGRRKNGASSEVIPMAMGHVKGGGMYEYDITCPPLATSIAYHIATSHIEWPTLSLCWLLPCLFLPDNALIVCPLSWNLEECVCGGRQQ